MLGRQSANAEECYKGNFFGAGFIKDRDLTHHLSENWRDFNKEFIPIYLEEHPDKSKIAAGLACGMLWTIAKGVKVGDVVLCPDGKGSYYVGEVAGEYEYQKGQNLPHRRSVRWYSHTISRDELSEALRHSAGSIGTLCDISKYSTEIEALIAGSRPATIVATDATIESPSEFVLEKHL